MSEPIYEPGPLAAPVTYQASGVSPLTPLTCYAEFDGTTASGPWKAALIFRSQAGHTFMVAATDETFAVGDDAAVSWFPRVNGGATATPTLLAGVKFAYTTMDQTTVNAGAGKVLPLAAAYFTTNAPSIWAQAGFNDVVFNAVGRYLCGISWRIGAPGFFATTFPGEMAVNKQPGRPATFGFDLHFDVASVAAAALYDYQWQLFTIDGGAYPTGQPLEYRFVNHTAVTLTLDAAVLMIQLDTDTTNLT